MIAYFVPGFGLSGGVRIILEHAQRLKDSGEDVIIINYTNNGKTQIKWFDCDVPIYTITDNQSSVSVKGFDVSRIDTLVVCLWFGIDIVDRLNGLREDVKRFYFIQGRDSMSYSKDMQQYIKGAEDTYKRKDYTPICVSSWLSGVVNEVGERKDAITLHNGIDLDFWSNNINKVKRQDVLLLEGSKQDFHKNMELSLRLAKIIKEVTGCKVWWVSKDQEEEVEFVDKMFYRPTREEIRDIYLQSRVLLKTTLHDGWGLPHMEAMASGCGVVTTNAFGNIDFCKHNKNSYVAKNVRKLIKYVIILLRDEASFLRITKNAKISLKKFTWDKILKKLIKIYK